MATKKTKLVIEFANKEAALHFKSWLDGQGEQDYWLWMDYREEEEDGDITALQFDYGKEDDLVIKTKCGRKSKDD